MLATYGGSFQDIKYVKQAVVVLNKIFDLSTDLEKLGIYYVFL